PPPRRCSRWIREAPPHTPCRCAVGPIRETRFPRRGARKIPVIPYPLAYPFIGIMCTEGKNRTRIDLFEKQIPPLRMRSFQRVPVNSARPFAEEGVKELNARSNDGSGKFTPPSPAPGISTARETR